MSNRADNFNRADSTTSLGSPSDGGSPWSALAGTWGIASNTAYCVTSTSQAAAVTDAGSAAVRVGVTLATYVSDIGLIARATDNNNYFVVVFSSLGIRIFRHQSGGFVGVGSQVTQAFSAGNLVVYEVNAANEHRIYLNGTLVYGPFTDSFNSTATLHGIRANSNTTARFDDFSITDLSASGSILPLAQRHRSRIMRGY